jgi:hypothetical protein
MRLQADPKEILRIKLRDPEKRASPVVVKKPVFPVRSTESQKIRPKINLVENDYSSEDSDANNNANA